MRKVTTNERLKRGCEDCADYQLKRLEPGNPKRVRVCIHDECPYHELDPYSSYIDYLKSPSQTKMIEALEKIFNFDRGMSF